MPTLTGALLGTWLISGLEVVAGEDGILTLLPEGRAVQFPTSGSGSRPEFGRTLRLWFSMLDENTIRFRMKPEGEEWLRFIERRTAEGWVMVCDDGDGSGRREFPCRRARTEDLPEWYAEMLGKNLERMDSLEWKG